MPEAFGCECRRRQEVYRFVADQGLFEFADIPDWEQAAAYDVQVADVVFNLPLEKPYTYSIPDEFRELLKAGMRVKTSLGRGNRSVIGYCVKVRQAESAVRKLKPIEEVLDTEPLLSQNMLELTNWIASRYLCGWGQVLESVIPAGVRRRSGTRLVSSYELSANASRIIATGKLPQKQQVVVDVLLKADGPIPAASLCELADCGPGPLNTLKKKGILTPIRISSEVAGGMQGDVEVTQDLVMNSQQEGVLKQIIA